MTKLTHITEASESSFELEIFDELRAGFPSPAADYAGDRIDLVRELTPHPDTTFYARVSGDSMKDAGILHGDIAIIDRSLEPRNGDFIVAFIDGEFTLKEFQMDKSGQFAMLIPHNPEYQPIKVTKEDDFRIWGVVTNVVHHYRR